ncbi:MAG: exodeoxyribonuclease VII large subunit [Oscillospiraceae bacterium]|nr:exodeoxyribonuclease VII large subunit [Oscillospiraceae bacterium]
MNELIFTVSQLNGHIKALLEADPMLDKVMVRGELSNYKIYPSGHHYFTMKDGESSLKCVMFRSSASRLRFRPESGMSVTAAGRVSVYPRDGAYQLYVTSLVPEGAGDLQIAFEQLKAKLAAEGLFDTDHKKPLPAFPKRVAVITSGAGAAVHDIIRVLGKRWPMAKILVLPVRVQGTEAPPEIVGAIRYANRYQVADVIITGRGGGSIEDLWAFNDERVARAIYESEIPVISAVGHEPDVTIADYVADRRAATPSNAAEIAGPDMVDVLANIAQNGARLQQAMDKKLDRLSHRLEELSGRPALNDPEVYLGAKRMALDYARASLSGAGEQTVADARRRYVALAAKLDALSPLKVLGRGYSIVEKDGAAVRQVSELAAGDEINVKLSGGDLDCVVKEVHHGERENEL